MVHSDANNFICDELYSAVEDTMVKNEQEKITFNEWMEKKAEPSVIELEKKQLNIRNKWETLVTFQKKKKIMLRHLKRKK